MELVGDPVRDFNRLLEENQRLEAEIERLRALVEQCRCWHTAGDPF